MIKYADLPKADRTKINAFLMEKVTDGEKDAKALSGRVADVWKIQMGTRTVYDMLKKHYGVSVFNSKADEREYLIPERPSFVRPTEPLVTRKHIMIPDTQCRPGEDLSHLLWAGKFVAENEPDVIIQIGDHYDMPSLSSYEKRGSHYFEGKRLSDDIAAGNEGFSLFERGLDGFPGIKKFLLGNHEDRLTRALNENPVLLDGVVGFEDFNAVELGWEMVDFLVPVEIDGIYYAHYFCQPNTGRSYAGNVETMIKNLACSFSMGHQQGLRWGRRELPNGRTHIGLVAGSYYQHNEEYRGPQAVNEWRGIVVKHEVRDGQYDPMMVSLAYLKKRYG